MIGRIKVLRGKTAEQHSILSVIEVMHVSLLYKGLIIFKLENFFYDTNLIMHNTIIVAIDCY